MKNKSDINEESIRLAIQAGIVASCLVVITSNIESLSPSFLLLIKLLALILGLISTIYIMLTARKYGHKKVYDSKIRNYLYDGSITFFWYILVSVIYIIMSNIITASTGISFEIIYVIVLAILTITIISLSIIKLIQKHKRK